MPTWTAAPAQPFGATVASLPLSADPLIRVVAQIRFAPVLRVRDQDYIAAFQESIRRDYPLASKEIQQQVAPGIDGALRIAESVVWRFTDLRAVWQLSLAEDFVALDCGDYSNRADFMRRLGQVLEAVAEHIRPVVVSRVGVRYTDRLSGDELLQRLPDFVRPELLGFAGTALGDGELDGQLTQAEFKTDGISLRGRWGLLPPGATHEASIAPVDARSWVLDLDAFVAETAPFDAERTSQEVERFAAIVYGFFRWAVSDEFLEAHGAEL